MNHTDLSLTRQEVIWGIIYLIFQNFLLPFLIAFIMPLLPVQTDAVYNFIIMAVNFTVTTILLRRIIARGGKRALEAPLFCLRTAGIGFFGYYVLTLVVAMLISMITPDFANVNDQNIDTMLASNYSLIALSVVLLAPVSEELLYRGLIFGALHRKSRLAAYIVSTVVFSLMHVVGYITLYDIGTLALCFVQYIPASVCLAWAYERSGSIITPMLIHIAVNQLSLELMR